MRGLLFALLLLAMYLLVGSIENNWLVNKELPIEDQVRDYIDHCGIQHADIVYKQALLETGHFRSRIFTEQNNLFGMKLARNRPTTAIGSSKNGSAIYVSWEHSVIDYLLFQQKYYKQGNYYKFLGRIYAEDSLYTTKLRYVK
jgi:uncharacterized FlgJ-related protein